MNLAERLRQAGLVGSDFCRVSREDKERVARALVAEVNERRLVTGSELNSALFKALNVDMNHTSQGWIQRGTVKSRYVQNNEYLRARYLAKYGVETQPLYLSIQEIMKERLPEKVKFHVNFNGVAHMQKVYFKDRLDLVEYISRKVKLKTSVLEYDFVSKGLRLLR